MRKNKFKTKKSSKGIKLQKKLVNKKSKVIKRLFDKSKFAMSSEETRYYLNGIFIHSVKEENEERFRVVATDGHRLSRLSTELPLNAKNLEGVIIPRKTVIELRKIIDGKQNTVKIQLSKNKIEEGKIVQGKITKITEKFVFVFISGLKSEPIIDVNELKMIGLKDDIHVGQELPVLLEKIEDKNGEVIVSAIKAKKIEGWYALEKSYENNQSIIGKIVSKCKGGVIVEHIDTGSLMFCPGSQISDKPLKNIDHLIGVEQKFAIIKLDKIRGNACVSRRQIVSSNKREDKAKIIEKFNVGDIIKDAVVKGYSSFGCFFEVNNEIDVLVHLQEISYSRVNHPDEIFNIGEKHDLKVISIDNENIKIKNNLRITNKVNFYFSSLFNRYAINNFWLKLPSSDSFRSLLIKKCAISCSYYSC